MRFQYFDTHSHLQDQRFDADRDDVLARMKERKIAALVVGTDREMNERAVALVVAQPFLWAAVGIHPVEGVALGEMEGGVDLVALETLARTPRVVAIGECGLDYFHITDPAKRAAQALLFRAQIELAERLGKPLMVHIRPSRGSRADAYEDALAILADYPRARGDIHFFAGTWPLAERFLAAGFTLSFTGAITFPPHRRTGARDYDEVIRNAPLDMLMVETDCPYVAPVPYRGKRNEPVYVEEMVRKVAEIRGEEFGAIRVALVANPYRVWGIIQS